ncbi:MAG TPA: MATE family efflux transporter, partial [Firmicutes bacterium]|nr:MATE family efflux transporter [Bacillota bacterium]
HNHPEANRYFSISLAVNVAVNLVAAIILMVFQNEIIRILNAKGIIFGYVTDYLGIMKFFYLFIMVNLTFSMFIRSEGKPQLSLVFGLAGNIINIILDYFFIIKLGMGMKGAAWASGISVFIPFLFGVSYFCSRRSVYKFATFQLRPAVLRKMLFLGSAEFTAQIAVSITTYVLNWVLLRRIGISGVAALTIVGYVAFVQNMILTGIAIGIHPLISYYFGAKNREIIFGLLSIALKTVIWTGVGFCLLALGAGDGIVRIFARHNQELIAVAGNGLRLYSLSFVLNGYNIIAAAYFTSVGAAKESLSISVARSLLLVNILILLLPSLFGNAGIWLAAPAAELLTSGLAWWWFKKSKANLLKTELPTPAMHL